MDKPRYRNPSAKAKDEPNIQTNRRGNHGLDAQKTLLLDCLCNDRATAEEPELIVEERKEPLEELLIPPPLQQQFEQHQVANEQRIFDREQ